MWKCGNTHFFPFKSLLYSHFFACKKGVDKPKKNGGQTCAQFVERWKSEKN